MSRGADWLYFNPRAPCGARHDFKSKATGEKNFNPRAPCGARRGEVKKKQRCLLFQPTRPLRGATCCLLRLPHRQAISTHAPLAGRDIMSMTLVPDILNFNPRAPCGARLDRDTSNSTLILISTHAPLAGRDRVSSPPRSLRSRFQPTRPLRGATGPSPTSSLPLINFNPRAPCGARR